MNPGQALTTTTHSHDRPQEPETHLQGRWLVVTWVIWIVLVAFTFGVFFGSLPVYFAQLQTVCAAQLALQGNRLLTRNKHCMGLISPLPAMPY